MKVLFLDHATELGGAEVSLLGLLRTLDRTRFPPTLACPPGRLAESARSLGVPVTLLSLERLRKDRTPWGVWSRLRRGAAALGRVIQDGGFDLLHANTLRTAVYAGWAGARLKIPWVWHVRDHVAPAWARRWLLRRCTVAVAPSLFIARSLGSGEKVRVVPNGMDLAELPGLGAAAAFRVELGLPADAPLVGCLGRLLPWKGQHLFLEVAARLAPGLPRARFLIVGAPLYAEPGTDYPAELKAQAARLAIGDRVLFVGHRDDPLAALSAMDVVVNCSKDEPFGRVLIEAMACGRPVVAFRSGAVTEIVVDGSTGLLVPFGDVTGMSEAICDLVRNRARAEAYGEAGRHHVEAHFALAASTRAIESLYAQLVKAKRAEGRA